MSRIYSVDEVFALLGKDTLSKTDCVIKSDSINVEGYLVYVDSWRYRTFYQKGTKCACCGKEGKFFKLKPDSHNRERAHFNLFTEDGILLTKDHIVPQSAGGCDCMDNFQTYCEECNRLKGSTIPNDISDELRRTIKNPKNEIQAENLQTGKINQFVNIEQAAEWLCKQKINATNIKPKDIISRSVKTTIRLSIAIAGESEYYGFKWSRL